MVGNDLPSVANLVVHKRVAGFHVYVLAALDCRKGVQAAVDGNRGAQDVDVLLCDGSNRLVLHEPREILDLLGVGVQHLRAAGEEHGQSLTGSGHSSMADANRACIVQSN
jgi:hypothetical protein